MRLPFRTSAPPRVSQRFGGNPTAYAAFSMKGHNGLDFPVVNVGLEACEAGTIAEQGFDAGGYGNYVVVRTAAGDEWLYGHLSSFAPGNAVGTVVVEGANLGTSGDTGNSTGPHLHLGYRPHGYDRNNGYLGYTNPRPRFNTLYASWPYRVILQAGHAPDGGGAPQEKEWTPRLVAALKALLEKAHVRVDTCGDYYPPKPYPAVTTTDADLYLSVHYDAAIYAQNTGCLIARGVNETENWEADRFLGQWLATYPKLTGIPPHQERVNPNMTYYYGYAPLTRPTPGLVLEHGVGAPGVGLDADTLWNHLDTVAQADAQAVLKYFGLFGADPGGLAMLNDEELFEALNRFWYVQRGVPAVKDNGFYKAWVERLRAGDYKGMPEGGEEGFTWGTGQVFEHGMAVWKRGGADISWKG